MIFLELPNFKLSVEECETDFERWIYVLKHMEVLERLPFETKRKMFERLAEVANISLMKEEERRWYEASLKNYRDTINCDKYAKEEGIAEGKELGRAEEKEEARKEKLEAARKLRAKSMSDEEICEILNISPEDLKDL